MRRIDRARLLLVSGIALLLAGRLLGELALAQGGELFALCMMLALPAWFGGLLIAATALCWQAWLFFRESSAVFCSRSRQAGSAGG